MMNGYSMLVWLAVAYRVAAFGGQMACRRNRRYVGAVDQGTTSTRFIIFDECFTVCALKQVAHQQLTPFPGWLEHDVLEIFSNVCRCIVSCVSELHQRDPSFRGLESIGITNQRETTVAWDRVSGAPLCPAIVWSDARTVGVVQEVLDSFGNGDVHFAQEVTGLPASTYFSAFKMRWMLQNVPAVQEALAAGTLAFGTIDAWLLYKLTDGRVFATDVSNASRTFLMDLKTLAWSEELCTHFGVPLSTLPEIRSNSEYFGDVVSTVHNVGSVITGHYLGLGYAATEEPAPAKIMGSIGDQQGALMGNMCFKPGQVKNTYGTGCFMLLNCGNTVKRSTHGLLSTVGYKIGEQKPVFALEGSIANAGGTLEWMQSNLGLYTSLREAEALAKDVPDSGGVIFVPAFGGLLAPYWDAAARGTIVGMTLKTGKRHIIRAAMESVALQVVDVVEAMKRDSGVELSQLVVDGGLSKNAIMMQLQANILGADVRVAQMAETSALGAALCAGLASGVWSSVEQIQQLAERHLQRRTVTPAFTAEQRRELRENWRRAIKQSRWAKL